MPVYEYRCPRGHVIEAWRPVALRSEPELCKLCGEWAEKRILHPPRVFGDYEGYESPASGNWIEGKRARKEDFLRTGTVAYEAGVDKQVARWREEIVAKQEAYIDDCVDRVAGELEIRD